MPLTAYYFMGQDLCMVRRHVRDDMAWMADIGTDSVAIGLHEFQLDYPEQQQLDILFEEADRAGIGVHAIPSRWAGLVAGWPPTAGMFAATHPSSWMIGPDGSPILAHVCGGAICSMYDPATSAFFQEAIDRMLDKWPLQGIIWDEIKVLRMEDHSEHAIRALGRPSRGEDQIRRTVEFFSQASRFARKKQPEVTLSCFIYAHQPDHLLMACAGINELDYFGIDGRCWPSDDPRAKVLLGNMERAVAACRAHGVGSLALIETQTANPGDAERTVTHLPTLLEQPIDHLLYYYYGASRVEAESCMNGMAPLLRAWRRDRPAEGAGCAS